MKFQLLIFIIGLFNVTLAVGRLIHKNKTRNVEEAQTEKPNPSIRLTRDIENDSLTGFSKEEFDLSEEFIQSYNKRPRYVFKAKETQDQKKTRLVRDSTENMKTRPKSKKAKELEKPIKPKTFLVKKPIPKFNDKDYGDFQSKISNSHIIADSGDHEDEDFNLEDYDFDINHDEFTSGRKLLEPRVSIKNAGGSEKRDMKIISKFVVPESVKTVSTKKQRAVDLNYMKKTDKTKKLDYYDDDYITTTKAPEMDNTDLDVEYSDELDNKIFSNRTVRSWEINPLNDKFTENVLKIAKFLGVLPLIAQMPNSHQYEDETESGEVMMDPLTGKLFVI